MGESSFRGGINHREEDGKLGISEDINATLRCYTVGAASCKKKKPGEKASSPQVAR